MTPINFSRIRFLLLYLSKSFRKYINTLKLFIFLTFATHSKYILELLGTQNELHNDAFHCYSREAHSNGVARAPRREIFPPGTEEVH